MEKEIRSRIELIQGDITKLSVDAIVNAANESLLGGGGVDGAIHDAAGAKLLAECKAIGGCPTGEARITKGYNLPAKYVIHTVGPVYGENPNDAELLASCYKNSLELSVKHNIRTIAFPAISCGIYGYPIEDACKIAVRAVAEFLKTHKEIEKAIFVLFSSDSYEVYRNCLKQA
jgi:O-acetyl-ADP-ribose deacetylase (regulator of RNase III)